MSFNVPEKVKAKIGRPKGVPKSLEEKREYRREKARIYYSNPVNKQRQKEKMQARRNDPIQRAIINKNKRDGKKQKKKLNIVYLHKRLKLIWMTRGLIKMG